ncbi:hypothetical protein OIU85_007614 [Salix viminalis]|uniref:Uncharacterized protein n=1 Tax=Salix viminalis TaxID=40686 RepID=A0A9Q0P970_SALVM|nr:hypothetical protein OIU85_007614 [Salix viminalis]
MLSRGCPWSNVSGSNDLWLCDGGFAKSTGGGRLAETITERFYLDSKQEAKVFEALEIGEDDVVSGTEPGFPNVIIIEGDAKVNDTTIYNSLKAVHRILQDVV